MTQEKPDARAELRQQLTQAWIKLAPVLRKQTLKVLNASISAFERLAELLATSTDSLETGAEAKSENAALAKLRPIALKLVRILLAGLGNLRRLLDATETAPSTLETTGDVAAPQATLPAASIDNPIWNEQVRKEVKVAWDFTREKVFPPILKVLTQIVEWLDPRVAAAWEKISEKVRNSPFFVETWEKVQANNLWKRSNTAAAPVWRSMGEVLSKVQIPENVKPILDKRAGSTALALSVVLLLLLKPTPASHLAKVSSKPTAPKVSQPVAKPLDNLLAPEKGESPVSPDRVLVADIQAQVASVSKKYGEALIQSVQTNFKLGRLIVEVTDAWYQLAPSKQEQLMSDLWGRSQVLSFKKLLVADATHQLIARSPAVGDDMVILRR